MDWLKRYEGGRGIAYLVGIVGAVAPTVIAIFLLDPAKFDSMEWSKIVLLSACTGGLSLVFCIAGALLWDPEAGPSTRQVSRGMRRALIVGSFFSLFFQLAILAFSTRLGLTLAEHVRQAILYSGIGISLVVLNEIIGRVIEGLPGGIQAVLKRRREWIAAGRPRGKMPGAAKDRANEGDE